MQRRLLLVVALFLFSASAYSQSAQPASTPPSDPNLKEGSKDDSPRFGSPEAEMRSKLELKDEKKKYDEHLARAKEVSQLASQLSSSYITHKGFTSDDQKRLERLEKLTKRIRNDSGGSETSEDADIKEIPPDMDDVLKKVSTMAGELQKLVESTPRNVISAAVIDQANKLIGIVQHLRNPR
jgi:hypothetical protein